MSFPPAIEQLQQLDGGQVTSLHSVRVSALLHKSTPYIRKNSTLSYPRFDADHTIIHRRHVSASTRVGVVNVTLDADLDHVVV